MGSDDRKRHGTHGANGTKGPNPSTATNGASKVREGKHVSHSHRHRRDHDTICQPASRQNHNKHKSSSSNQSHADCLPSGKPKVRSRSAFEPTVRSDISRHDKNRPSSLTPTPAMTSGYAETRTASRAGTKGSSNASSKAKCKKKTTGPVHNARYKAKLCKNWAKTGFCPYFEKCQFAHGSQELEKWANRRARIKAANERDSCTESADEQVHEIESSEEETKDGFIDQPETGSPVEGMQLLRFEEDKGCVGKGRGYEKTAVETNKDERLEVEVRPAVVQKHFVDSYYAQAVETTTNQCIDQLFTMSTVFPSSILRN